MKTKTPFVKKLERGTKMVPKKPTLDDVEKYYETCEMSDMDNL